MTVNSTWTTMVDPFGNVLMLVLRLSGVSFNCRVYVTNVRKGEDFCGQQLDYHSLTCRLAELESSLHQSIWTLRRFLVSFT